MSQTKWQRLKYMHGLPLYGEKRITESAGHVELSKCAARDGMVLLKNESNILPFSKGTKVAVFGKAQSDYVKGGGGSGDVTSSYVIPVLEGLKQKELEEKIHLFRNTSDYYESYVNDCYKNGGKPGLMDEPVLPDELIQQARVFTDIAIFTISRYSKENYDRKGTKHDGDYFLSRAEEDAIQKITSVFSMTIVVLNVGGIMDTSWFCTNPKIQGALFIGQAGMAGGIAVADILVGDANPSGRLASTMAADLSAYPSFPTFKCSDAFVEYEEDIFVGYRYFETIPGANKMVCYPFGYGLSYTKFEISESMASIKSKIITITTSVTNIGDRQGRTVLQVYCQAPQGKLCKANRVLVAFAKTEDIAPGEVQTVKFSFPIYAFSSYDDEGLISKASYLIEAGDYYFHIGENVRDTKLVYFTGSHEEQDIWLGNSTCLHFNSDLIFKQLSPRCIPKALKRRLSSNGEYRSIQTTAFSLPDDEHYPSAGTYPQEAKWAIPFSAWEQPEGAQFKDVAEGKISLDDFINTLADEEKVHLLGGQPNRGVANTFGMGNLFHKGIPNVMTADGPAGLHLKQEAGVTTTAFPCASLLACTWDREILYRIGCALAEEAHENGIGVLLTPAVNIQRDPLCGRNFEYYSEDPLLTGELASHLIKGIQAQGVASSLKHFACNNKETNRHESDSRISERALREIYIRPFEICVSKADPWTIMSAYNLINGVRASSNKDLLTHILRDEWGYTGLVTTDWYTHCEQWKEINAGNDIKMGSGTPEYTMEKLKAGDLNRKALENSVRRILELILRLR